MKKNMEHVNESMDKGYYLSVIEQSKNAIVSVKSSNEVKLEMKRKLLICIDKNSRDDSNNYIMTNEILSIFDNKELMDQLSNHEKSLLYNNLGDNYFLLGKIDLSIESYMKSYELGDIEIFKEVIFMKIYNHFLENKSDINFGSDIIFSLIINDIEENKSKVYYLNELESDLEEFFVGGIDYIKNPKEVEDIIYNLEVKEEIGFIELNKLDNEGKITERIEERGKLAEELSSGYTDLANKSGNLDVIYELHENMIARFGGEEIDYQEFTKYLRDFLITGTNIIDSYLKNGEDEKGLEILRFIVKLGFTNLSVSFKGFIVEYIIKLVNGYDENQIKIEGLLKDNNYNELNIILRDNINNGLFSKEIMVDLGDLFLSIGSYLNAYSCYIATGGLLNFNDKITNILETILFENDFSNLEGLDKESHPEIGISLLLEKIENGDDLNRGDYSKIEYICRLVN